MTERVNAGRILTVKARSWGFIKATVLVLGCLIANLSFSNLLLSGQQVYQADVCVYGGTASGMMAAVAAAKGNKSVIVVEPSRWLGGFIGGGSRVLRDCAYPDEIGGLTRMMMQKDIELDGGPPLDTYADARSLRMGFGPHDGMPLFRELFVELADENDVEVIYQHRLGEVVIQERNIQEIRLDYAPPQHDGCPTPIVTQRNAIQIKAKVFIDASYESDLMAKAGVSYVIGRESRDKYNESLAGQRNLRVFDISPYLIADDPSSGLLPMIDSEPYEEGAASRHIIAYNFRILWQPDGEGVPLGEPTYYNPEDYALIHRALKINPELISWPHNNYDRRKLISSGIPGRQSDYPDAGWPERAKIWREWIDHYKIMHKLTASNAGLNPGEYPDTNDFPHQFYTRIARRMVGEYVMTQHDLMLQTDIKNPIGLAYYMVDIYPPRLIATPDGKVASEGEIAVMVSPGPYQIPYGAITAQNKECKNLLVPVCISASHVALSSIRMEPTYMIMGEAAGIAAVRALEENVDVQKINQAVYKEALLNAGMVLGWNGTGYEGMHTENEQAYGNVSYWISNPEEYAKRPYSSIYKGKR